MTFDPVSDMSRTFRVASPFKAVLPAVLAGVLGSVIVVLVVGPEERNMAWIFMAVVLLLSLGLSVSLVRQQRLEVTDKGMRYYAPGFRVFSPWENVQDCTRRALGMPSYDVLLVRNPVIDKSWWVLPGSLKGYDNMIPVGLFSDEWRTGELGELVKRYAPEAFSTML
jgi:hypothetical protein